jgi:hypothetical protein
MRAQEGTALQRRESVRRRQVAEFLAAHAQNRFCMSITIIAEAARSQRSASSAPRSRPV